MKVEPRSCPTCRRQRENTSSNAEKAPLSCAAENPSEAAKERAAENPRCERLHGYDLRVVVESRVQWISSRPRDKGPKGSEMLSALVLLLFLQGQLSQLVELSTTGSNP